jgi:hypothetical protein
LSRSLNPPAHQVKEILNDKELRGVVINDHKLGQRKNCNLPGGFVWS